MRGHQSTPRGWEPHDSDRLPLNAIAPQPAAVAVALINGARSVRDIGAVLGVPGSDTPFRWRKWAQNLGLVGSDPGKRNTTHSRLKIVEPPAGARSWVAPLPGEQPTP